MNNSKKLLVLLFFIGMACCVQGQSRMERMQQSSLFSDTSILKITLKYDVQAVSSDLEERNNHPATLTYLEAGEEIEIHLQLKVRGKTRANPKVCEFPPLRLNFKKSKNDDNLFAGQDKLKLVGHCDYSKSYEQYVLQEYLTYKHYNLLTDFSFRVRLLEVTYEDTASDEVFTKYGFLIEDIESLAYRTETIEKGEVVNQDRCDQSVLDIMTVFQYMIGNTDWSVTKFHNTKLLARDSTARLPIPVPYDFDYCGAINAHYAIPPADLPIQNVRMRIFRGYCRLPGKYEKVFVLFSDKKKEIYSLYQNFGRLTEKRKKLMTKYLDSFYDTIENPKKASREIIKACSVPHRHVY